MAIVLLFFWRVCLLRLSPEISPKHPLIMGMVMLANICFTTVVAFLVTERTLLQCATGIVVQVAALAAFIHLGCILRGVGERFTPTVITSLGCDLVISAIVAVVVPLARLLSPAAAEFAALLLLTWLLFVFGFILSKALNLNRVVGFAAATAMLWVSLQLGVLAGG